MCCIGPPCRRSILHMTTATGTDPWRPSDSLANRLRLVRGELGLSQREAADRAGITARVWQNAEDGRTIRSERAVLAAIALAFGVDREWLLWGGALNAERPHQGGPDGGDECPQSGSNRRPADYKADVLAFPARQRGRESDYAGREVAA